MQQITDMHDMEQLYRECKPVVYRYLHTLCSDDLLIEEVAQETFYQIISRCCTMSGFAGSRFFRRREPMEVQICHFARQLLFCELFRIEQERPTEQVVSLCERMPAMEYLPETSVLYQAELGEVQEKIEHLREPMRSVISLRYYRGMTYKEIAAYLRQSENWVKHMLHSGKMQISQSLRYSAGIYNR